MNPTASLLDVDTVRLINALAILILGGLLAWGLSRAFVWLLRKVRWDEKIAFRSKGQNAARVDKVAGRLVLWLLILGIIILAVGEVSGIKVIVDISNRVNEFFVSLSSNFLIMFVFRILVTFAVSLLFVYLWRKIRTGSEWLALRVDQYRQRRLNNLKIQNLEVLSRNRITGLIRTILKYFSWLVYLLLIIIYLSVVAAIFPAARPLGAIILTPVWLEIGKVVAGFIKWVPSLINLILICLAGFYLTRLARYFFRELGKGSIRIKGFYPEWSEPTYQLVRVFIIALTIVFAFPFIPGSSSPAFQGVSVFLGLLISLGSTSVIANIMAGIVLTYTHAFSIGDRVQIGSTTGDIVNRSLLVTTVRTVKNEDVTIPNNVVLGGHIVNFTQEASQSGLILYTSVTIGYDTPWRQVHQALIAAAQATKGILEEPEPFVLQTALNDFFVSYQINAYTNTPGDMAHIYSELHQNIQDKFNEAGLEILSPHYTQLRDGNRKAVPDEYLPSGYKKPGFKVEKD